MCVLLFHWIEVSTALFVADYKTWHKHLLLYLSQSLVQVDPASPEPIRSFGFPMPNMGIKFSVTQNRAFFTSHTLPFILSLTSGCPSATCCCLPGPCPHSCSPGLAAAVCLSQQPSPLFCPCIRHLYGHLVRLGFLVCRFICCFSMPVQNSALRTEQPLLSLFVFSWMGLPVLALPRI